jgi:hypothetical protein
MPTKLIMEYSKEAILELKRYGNIEKCGVYFLIKNDEIVYVGQSIRIFSRLYFHLKDKDYDSFTFIEFEPHMLIYEETRYILKFLPKYNHGITGRAEHIAEFGWCSRGSIIFDLKLDAIQLHVLDKALSEMPSFGSTKSAKIYKKSNNSLLLEKINKYAKEVQTYDK